MIRNAVPADLPAILNVYASARAYMAAHGNPTQWGTTYPEPELLEEDIRQDRLYTVEQEGRICGAFVFFMGDDPTYGYIEGAWRSDAPYGVIHRVASDGTLRGMLAGVLDFCRARCSHLRIDTHADNLPMQHLLEVQGFARCGIIYLEDGSPRIAYDWM